MIINTQKIEEAIYNLCITANTVYSQNFYDKITQRIETEKNCYKKNKLENILKNANIALTTQRPLCQDTGQVIVFAEIGQNIVLEGINFNQAINNGVAKAYKNECYRKSTVENALTKRINTNDNTPAIIYTNITDTNDLKLKLLIKGAGSENYSTIRMFTPANTENDIFEYIKKSIQKAGEKSCPPLVLGIGIGGTMEQAGVLSKHSFFKEKNTEQEIEFIQKLEHYLGDISDEILAINIETSATHIASMPVALTINCHSCRHAECKIVNSEIIYKKQSLKTISIKKQTPDKTKEIKTDDLKAIHQLKSGEEILLTGEIYTARDAAHKKIKEIYENTGKFPIELQNKIIFYAGPCPAKENEIIGPIGPTTSNRMDAYTELMYKNGLIATIGKGERSEDTVKLIKKYKGKYFTAQGGIACLLASCIKKVEIIAFEELGTEAVRKIYVEKMPLKVEI